MGERDGDRPKKSWRDIDARRDRSSSSTPSTSSRSSSGSGGRRDDGPPRSAADNASKQYRAALEALFEKGGVGKIGEKLGASSLAPVSTQTPPVGTPATGVAVPARATPPVPAADTARAALRKKLVEAIGRDAITKAADRYLKDNPLPDDFELLEQLLEHRDDDRVRETIDRLDAMLVKDKPKRNRVMAAKLRMIEETSDDRELCARASATRARLGTPS